MKSPEVAGQLADELVAAEVLIQDKMWAVDNNRADATKGQLLSAACAQAMAIEADRWHPGHRELHFDEAKNCLYPKDWDGFRDYGSDIANLVVAAAYLRSEIKRRLVNGEDMTRSKRGEPYKHPNQPLMSSEEAAK